MSDPLRMKPGARISTPEQREKRLRDLTERLCRNADEPVNLCADPKCNDGIIVWVDARNIAHGRYCDKCKKGSALILGEIRKKERIERKRRIDEIRSSSRGEDLPT